MVLEYYHNDPFSYLYKNHTINLKKFVRLINITLILMIHRVAVQPV